MKRRLVALAVLATVSLTSGCGLLESASAGAAPATKSTAKAQPTKPQPTPSTKAEQPETSVKDSGDIPDPCTLLSEAEVTGLTGRIVSQIDEDGVESGESARFCQWQQEGGQLAVFLSRTTPADFQVTVADAQWVDGVGEDAYAHSGHLFVLYGTVQVDVYSRGASDEQNIADAKQVAKLLLTRI
ncbi:hypothetical protein FB565_007520 [Actinoplanes lutulentus]|uniref:Uncharacterized protein DUF3558 n=1 Tax=Actinoplanes lutulentus TaxID=1287878 RepID=A0A327Z3N2_9ACTN|nr:DUF3558 family protein [Actinoplanes lutulentus]MBB2947749.1 hypothetical protein [Actinoplanes lutulentus]RAK29937.1 uncharacterized protein DUF3558 [Actinoplanes lutulentus]